VLVGPGDVTAGEAERIGESFANNWKLRTETPYPNLGFTATLGDTLAVADRTAGYVATVGYGVKQLGYLGEVKPGLAKSDTNLLGTGLADRCQPLRAREWRDQPRPRPSALAPRAHACGEAEPPLMDTASGLVDLGLAPSVH
jgi:hypothetical protein